MSAEKPNLARIIALQEIQQLDEYIVRRVVAMPRLHPSHPLLERKCILTSAKVERRAYYFQHVNSTNAPDGGEVAVVLLQQRGEVKPKTPVTERQPTPGRKRAATKQGLAGRGTKTMKMHVPSPSPQRHRMIPIPNAEA